jgi:CRISPR/Cas system-associated protein Csm6
MHWCYRGDTDCAGGFVGDVASSWHGHGVIYVTAAAGFEPESAALGVAV